MSDSLQPHGLQPISLPCPSLSWSLLKLMCIELVMPFKHLILYCPFSSCPQSFLVLGSSPKSFLFASGGLSIGASASVLPMNILVWFPLGLPGLISLLSKGLSRVFSSTAVQKHQFFNAQPSLWSNSHICTWKNHSFDFTDLCWQSDVSAF